MSTRLILNWTTYFCDRYSENNRREDRFFLAHNVRGLSTWLLAPWLWAYGETEHHGSSDVWWGKVAPLRVTRKERDQKETQDKMEPAKASLSDRLLPVGTISEMSIISQCAIRL